MISILISLLIVGFCFYIGILYINVPLLTIGYALLILMGISVVELLYRFFTIQCYIDVPISMTEDGRPVQVMIKVRNKGFLPAGKVETKIEDKNVFHEKSASQWITIEDVTIGEHKRSVSMEIKGAGCHDLTISRIKIYSHLGFLYLTKPCKDFCSVLVMPQVHSVNLEVTEAVRNFLGDSDVYDEFRPGHDSGETFEIRNYREKDKLQSIHWKLSAKMDELMVKENSLPKACAVIMLLEVHPWKKNRWKRNGIDASGYLDLVASLSYALMDQKCPHFVAWYSAEKDGIRRIRVDDEESFYIFLNAYLREVNPTEKSLREEYRKDFRNEWYLHDIVINEKLELYKNGELVTKLDEKKIQDECEKMELLL